VLLDFVEQSSKTDPRYLIVEESVEDVLIGKDRVSCDAVQKGLEHTSATCNQCRILTRFGLLDSIVADCLL